MERAEAPTSSCPGSSVNPSSPRLEVPQGGYPFQKVVVKKCRRSSSLCTLLLRMIGQLFSKSAPLPSHTSSPRAIEVEEGKVEVLISRCRPPHDPQVHGLIMDFLMALESSFDPEPSREAFDNCGDGGSQVPVEHCQGCRESDADKKLHGDSYRNLITPSKKGR